MNSRTVCPSQSEQIWIQEQLPVCCHSTGSAECILLLTAADLSGQTTRAG